MQSDPTMPPGEHNSTIGNPPALMSASEPAAVAAAPPPLPTRPPGRSASVRQLLTVVLSVCLGLFLVDAVVSLLDDSLILLFGLHLLAGIRGFVVLSAIVTAIVIYCLMGFIPAIPKRLFVPVTLFNPVATLAGFPILIFFYGRMQQMSWIISLIQVLFGLGILFLAQGGLKFRWPLIPEDRLVEKRFSWLNLSVFLAANVVVLLPVAIVYLVFCTRLAVDHFSDGFLKLGRTGLTVEARKYVRNDGKVVQLFPMAHVGDASFYHTLSRSFPTNSVILMEGVTDHRNLLTNKVAYTRMAKALGVAEQHEEFYPKQGEIVWADVDVESFTKNTIGFLNLVMLVHAQGLNAQTVLMLTQYSPPTGFEELLMDDLLRKRNRHLLGELNAQLSRSEHLVVPWGVAHMPEVAREIQKLGFRLESTQEYVAMGFGSATKNSKNAQREPEEMGK